MNSAEKKLFLTKLSNESDQDLLKTLDYYRKNSDLDLLPNILDILKSDRGAEIKDAVTNLCLDIRTADTAITVMDYIKTTTHIPTRRQLMSIIWQTGQDLSLRAADIIDLLIAEDDFQGAFDCLTVLENCTEGITAQTAESLMQKVRAANGNDTTAPLLQSAYEYLLRASMPADENFS